jgi:hypothetical protein
VEAAPVNGGRHVYQYVALNRRKVTDILFYLTSLSFVTQLLAEWREVAGRQAEFWWRKGRGADSICGSGNVYLPTGLGTN